ncbi:MAG: hypothetical protein IJD92_05085 [Bacilli bacterium]|nr:hypothetical protein [Bacilli bacterium]
MFINEEVFNNLYELFLNNKNSHSYIFYTNDFFSCQKDVNLLIDKLFNNNESNKITDYITIPKSDKKNILKEDMLELKNFFKNTSYINDKRVYLIEEVHKLNSSSANMILKFLEEPNPNIIALFITDNLDSVLLTIKSRCQIVNCYYESNIEISDDKIIIIDNLFNNNVNKYVKLYNAKRYFEKYDRNDIIDLFNEYLKYCYSCIFEPDKIILIKKINRVISMLNHNVNIDYVLDYILLEGSEINGS